MDRLVNQTRYLAGLVAIGATLVSFSIFIVSNSPFLYWWAVRYFNLRLATGVGRSSLVRGYLCILRYLQVPWNFRLSLGAFKYSERGLVHFQDVRRLVMFNNLCLLIAGGYSVNLIRSLANSKTLWTLLTPLKMWLTSLLILVVWILIDFQEFFIGFHKLMFRNRDWIFNSRLDPVIKALPDQYFGWCFIAFCLVLFILMSVFIYYCRNENMR